MTEKEIEREIVSVIADISGHEPHEITPDKHFYEDLELDSIKAIEIAVALEKKFRVAVRDEDVPKITTVRQAVELVNTLLQQSAAQGQG